MVHAQQKEELVAVMDLGVLGGTEPQRVALSNQLRAELAKTGKVTMVDRSQMEAIMQEQALQQSGCTSQECAVQVGQLLGVRKIVTGTLTKIEEDLWQVAVQLLEVETGKVLVQDTFNHEGNYRTLLQTGMTRAALALVGERPPEVAAVAPPPPPPPTTVPPPPPEAEVSDGSGWAVLGWTMLIAAGVVQVVAVAAAGEAQTLADESRTENDPDKYDDAQTQMDSAETLQNVAAIAAGFGLISIMAYALSSDGSSAKAGNSPPDQPLVLSLDGGKWALGWQWRW
jgi:TolB-like protein